MPGIAFEALLILLLILANGALAMSEIAILSARRLRLKQRADEGDRKAAAALALAENPADFLSTVQVGITLVATLAGAFGGAALAGPLAAALGRIPALAPYSQGLALAVVVLLITYFSLVLGELAPKRLALSDPERIAAAAAGPLGSLARIAAPVVRVLSASTDLVLRLAGVRASEDPPVTEDEVRSMIALGTQAGVFQESEQDMVAGVFRLGDRRAASLMTPRPEIVWLDLEDSPDENRRKILECDHSYLPVGRGSLDELQGVVRAKTLLRRSLAGEPFNLETALEPPLYVPELMPALQVMEVFRKGPMHMALVIDEYGGVQGVVTIHDILETIAGDFPSPDEAEEPQVIQRADGSWLLDGMLPVDEFNELFRPARLPGQEKGEFQTLGGFVMKTLGRIPTSGDRFEAQGLSFEVVDMDGFRVDKVLVVPAPAPDRGPGSG